MAWQYTRLESTSSGRQKNKRTAQEVYAVIFNSNATAIDAETASGIPSIGSTWSGDPLRRCVSISAKESNTRRIWEVTCSYESLDADEATALENPLLRPVTVSMDGETIEEPFVIDHDEKPVLNSAGQPFENGGTITKTYRIIKATKNFATGTIQWGSIEYQNTVNTNSFSIKNGAITIAPRMGYLQSLTGEVGISENGVTYDRVSISVKVQGKSYYPYSLLDMGLEELDSGELKKILDKDGKEIKHPWPLNGSGAAKANPTDTPATLDFRLPEAAWGINFN